jgi:FMN reductase
MASGQRAKIVGLGGSLAAASRSLAALRIAAAAAEEEGAEVRIFEVRELDLPFYESGREPAPRASVFADAVHEADGCC